MTANGGAGSQAVQAEHAGRKLGLTLSQHHIIHVGIYPRWTPIPMDCSHPAVTFFLAGFRGKGRILVNDHWQILKPNYACWLPANAN
jgi:hypothetical protein